MIHLISAINWVSVLVAFFAYFFLGAAWYMFLFKKPYAFSLGKTADTLQNSAPIFIIGPAICTIVITVTCALLMQALGIHTYNASVEFAFIIGLGYLVTNTVNIAINPNIPRPLLYGLITGLFHLTAILIITTIIVAMG